MDACQRMETDGACLMKQVYEVRWDQLLSHKNLQDVKQLLLYNVGEKT